MAIEIVLRISSDELTEAVDRFEQIHGTICSAIPSFVLALVNFTHEILQDSYLFYGVDDQAAKIFELIGEDSIPHYLRKQYEEVEDRLHTIEGNDEIWLLIEAIVRAVIAQDDQLIANGTIPIR